MAAVNIEQEKRNYDWNRGLLITSKRDLTKLPKSKEVNREILLLNTFLSTYNGSPIQILSDSFITNFKRDKQSIIFDYYDYIDSIINFTNKNNITPSFNVYSKTDQSIESIFATVHDFYKGLDDQWFKIFNSLYEKRKETFTFDTERPFSMYLPLCNLWLSSIPYTNTIEDYTNLAHEYAHGIADILNGSPKILSPDNILLELFPMVMEMILTKDKTLCNRIERYKYYVNNTSNMITYAREIALKSRVYEEIVDVKNPRNLARILRRKDGIELTKKEVIDIWSNLASETICYVYNYLVAIKLVKIYNEDKELFVSDMNEIMTSNEKPKELLKRLNILPEE